MRNLPPTAVSTSRAGPSLQGHSVDPTATGQGAAYSILDVDLVMQSGRGRERSAQARYAEGVAYAGGQYGALSDAQIPLLDAGFLACDAVYEKLTVSHGRYFRLADHFERFARSCASFRLRNPCSDREMIGIFDRLMTLIGLEEAGLFWCVTRGLATSDRADPYASPHRLYAFATPYLSIVSQQERENGIDLFISENHIRIPPKAVDPTAKSFHWMDMKLSLFEARDRGMDWSVLTDREGYLTEAPGANVFLVKEGALYTPDCGCLLGITRKATLELAEELGVQCHVEPVHASQLIGADEAFMTSSAGGIMPVKSVDGIALGGVAGPGQLTTRLHNLYWERMWDGWEGTPVTYDANSTPAGNAD